MVGRKDVRRIRPHHRLGHDATLTNPAFGSLPFVEMLDRSSAFAAAILPFLALDVWNKEKNADIKCTSIEGQWLEKTIRIPTRLALNIVSYVQSNTNPLEMAATATKPLAHHRVLSPTASIKVSPICLGAMNFGDVW